MTQGIPQASLQPPVYTTTSPALCVPPSSSRQVKMRFSVSITTAIASAAVLLTSAAVIPRANLMPSGIEARYYHDRIYDRSVHPVVAAVVFMRAPSSDEIRARRLHARDFQYRNAD
ncbi:unnamed protein product [Cyclocybe aegerita]|uniref:Uncharacterized protein n=1 Tax=Cyclocybe aegerita TaxID=1973307 RepID=A0A8S0WPG8_CYCAE|nr:unnamed protein product [Cyclocybe aegerita]